MKKDISSSQEFEIGWARVFLLFRDRAGMKG
jgi:hypothetical protein